MARKATIHDVKNVLLQLSKHLPGKALALERWGNKVRFIGADHSTPFGSNYMTFDEAYETGWFTINAFRLAGLSRSQDPSTLPDEDKFRTIDSHVSPRWPAVNIRVFGNRDPRGPDNNVRIWLDTMADKLHIRVQKAERCYKFFRIIETRGYVEIVQE